MKFSKNFFLIGFFLLVKDVSAYIDPGTGAMTIGAIWPMILAFFGAICTFCVKLFWKPIKAFFKKDK